MKINNWKSLKKGTGIIVNIPGDEHEGVQNLRPGIVLNSNPDYVIVQLLSSRSNPTDFYSFKLHKYKTQYIRSIYLKNIPLNQIKDFWWIERKKIQLDPEGSIVKEIEKNPYKASSITLSLDEYLNLKDKILQLEKENQNLKEEKQKYLYEQQFEYEYEE